MVGVAGVRRHVGLFRNCLIDDVVSADNSRLDYLHFGMCSANL